MKVTGARRVPLGALAILQGSFISGCARDLLPRPYFDVSLMPAGAPGTAKAVF